MYKLYRLRKISINFKHCLVKYEHLDRSIK